MTDTPMPPARQETFGDAVRASWQRNSSGLTRYAYFAVVTLAMIAVHVALIAVVGNTWSWLAVVALPPAAFFIFAGWVYQRLSWRVLGLLLFVFGAMVPFYLM